MDTRAKLLSLKIYPDVCITLAACQQPEPAYRLLRLATMNTNCLSQHVNLREIRMHTIRMLERYLCLSTIGWSLSPDDHGGPYARYTCSDLSSPSSSVPSKVFSKAFSSAVTNTLSRFLPTHSTHMPFLYSLRTRKPLNGFESMSGRPVARSICSCSLPNFPGFNTAQELF